LQVGTFEDLMGRIGGIFGLLFGFVQWVLGPYMLFESRLRWMKKFYKFKSKYVYHAAGRVLKKNHKIDFGKFSILGTYILNYSALKSIFKRCVRNGKQSEIMQIVEKGMDQLNKDFDFYDISKWKK